MVQTVIGLYDRVDDAHAAVQDLVDRGFRREAISVVSRQADTVRERAVARGEDLAAEGAGTGAGVGGFVGLAAGLLLGLGVFAIPGIGPLLAAGPLITSVAGAGLGAGIGALGGGLTQAGVPEEEARRYAEGVERGGILVAVEVAEHSVPEAAQILERHGAVDLASREERWRSEGWAPADREPADRAAADCAAAGPGERGSRAGATIPHSGPPDDAPPSPPPMEETVSRDDDPFGRVRRPPVEPRIPNDDLPPPDRP